jgi:hypothetical protein
LINSNNLISNIEYFDNYKYHLNKMIFYEFLLFF